ncbi:hypothetical protein [Bradyrhizobium sp. HKCCYLRH3083]|uniref:hypothetical protein n=1 Tax=unclassified Bradyrhizobium TaxID=2631580 RepID=UPI003EC0C9DD
MVAPNPSPLGRAPGVDLSRVASGLKGRSARGDARRGPDERGTWGARKRTAFDGADIVFLDPDNGIGADSEKQATLSEIRLPRKPDGAIVFITFPGRTMPHDAILRRLHEG